VGARDLPRDCVRSMTAFDSAAPAGASVSADGRARTATGSSVG